MNAIFEAMGFEVKQSPDRSVMQLRYILPELDLARIQQITWALYVQMEQVYRVGPVVGVDTLKTAGILPCQGDVDKDAIKFVLNFTQREEINIGSARLYCDPVGWNFNSMIASTDRDPTSFVIEEMFKLKSKFFALTGKRFDETVAEDLSNHKWSVRSADIRRQVS